MNFRIFLKLIILVLCFACSSYAEHRKIIGLGNLENYLPYPGRPRVKQTLLKFHTSIRGLGTARFTFDLEKQKFSSAKYIDSNGNKREADLNLTLLEGFLKIRNRALIPVHATLKRKTIKVEFNTSSPRNLRFGHYTIFINKNKKAKVRRKTITESFFGTCETLKFNPSAKDNKNYINYKNTNPVKKSSAIKTLNIAVEGDKDWYTDFGEDSQLEITSAVSAADTIYKDELGLSFNIVRQTVFTDRNFGGRDNENQVNAVTMLLDYQSYTSSKSYFDDADAFHLFSGGNVKDNVIGLAYLGVICANKANSFAYTARSGYTGTESITFAHEMGHNFNAEHSSSGIMQAILDFPIPDSFSSDSINAITNFAQSNDSCLSGGDSDDDDDDNSDDDDYTPPENDGSSSETGHIEIDLNASIGTFSENKIEINLDNFYTNTTCDFKVRAGTKRSKVTHNGTIIYLLEDITNLGNFSLDVVYNKLPRLRNRRNGKRNKLFFLTQVICDNGQKGESNIVRIKPDYTITAGRRIKPKRWLRHVGKNFRISQ